jgi:hypothetical protein
VPCLSVSSAILVFPLRQSLPVTPDIESRRALPSPCVELPDTATAPADVGARLPQQTATQSRYRRAARATTKPAEVFNHPVPHLGLHDGGIVRGRPIMAIWCAGTMLQHGCSIVGQNADMHIPP